MTETEQDQYTCILCGQPVLREGSECFDCRHARPAHLRVADSDDDTGRGRRLISAALAVGLVAIAIALGTLSTAPGPALRWATDGLGEITAIAPVAENCVLLGGGGGRVVALDEASGRERWRRSLQPAVPVRAVETRGGQAYVTTRGALHVLDVRAGTITWEAELDRPSDRATLTPELALVGEAGSVEAYDLATGESSWSFSLHDGERATGIACLGHTGFFATFGAGHPQLIALDLDSRVPTWEAELVHPVHQIPAISSGTVCVVADYEKGQLLLGFDATTGKLLWQRRHASSAPAVYTGTLLLTEWRQGVTWFTAVDAATGTLQWTTRSSSGPADTPRCDGDTAIFAAGRTIHALRLQNGRLRWSRDAGCDLRPVLAAGGGSIYAATTKGSLLAFDAPR